MKKNLLTLVMLLLLTMAVRSQQLQNTYWRVYNPSGTFFQYFHFGVDTLFFSADNITYINRSIFSETGNLFTMNDPSNWPGQCNTFDTGRYTFTIQNDTLDFTLVSDPCTWSGRPVVMDTYIFVRLTTTGIECVSPGLIFLSPNPSANGIFNLKPGRFDSIIVQDAKGRKVFEENNPHDLQNYSINLQSLSPGIYFVKISEGQQIVVKKIVKM